MKSKFWMCLYATALLAPGMADAQEFGPIFDVVASRPGNLITPLNRAPKPVEKFT